MAGPAAPWALFVSPHYDDAAFSCSATMSTLGRRGYRIALATVFTRSVMHPTGFALACQIDKGLAADVDYMAIRRDEDDRFARDLGIDRVDRLDLPEAPHRGYDSAPRLFAGVLDGDRVDLDVADRLDPIVERLNPAWIFAPRGFGNHADHLQVIRAILSRPSWLGRVAWYRDLPYAAKFPAARPGPEIPADRVEVAIPQDAEAMEAKFRGSNAYASQVPFQFGGGIVAIRSLLGSFADREAERFGLGGAAEVFALPPGRGHRPDPFAPPADL